MLAELRQRFRPEFLTGSTAAVVFKSGKMGEISATLWRNVGLL